LGDARNLACRGGLELYRLAQGVGLVHRQVAPLAGREVSQLYRPEAHARKLYYGVAHGDRHEAHLALAAFVDGDAQGGVALGVVQHVHFGG
jgi:hypothetical protein